jgi:hypothetical protein
VLFDHHLLRRGYPVQGVICGRACRPLPASAPPFGVVCATLRFSDDFGSDTALSVELAVDHGKVCAPNSSRVSRTRVGLFETGALK